MRIHFENAKRLYRQKLLPMLEKEHGLTAEDVRGQSHDDARAQAFRAGDGLIKTLLLAALVPQVDALKALNSARLAALNHGSITAPIPGRESKEVLRRVRAWASQVGEIKVGEEADPSIGCSSPASTHELFVAAAETGWAAAAGPRRASTAELEGLYSQMERVLLEIGYLHEANPRRMMRVFRALFGRAGLDAREVRALRGIFRQVAWFAGRLGE